MTESLRALALEIRNAIGVTHSDNLERTLANFADKADTLADRLASPGAGAVAYRLLDAEGRVSSLWADISVPSSHATATKIEPGIPPGYSIEYAYGAAALAARDAEIAGLRDDCASTKVILECARRDIAKWRGIAESAEAANRTLRQRVEAAEADARDWPIKGELKLLAFFQNGDDPFIYAVDGMVTLSDFAEIESMLRSEPEAYFERGDGEYTFQARYDPGERNEYGRFFQPAGWDLESVAFTSTAIDAAKQAEPTGGRGDE